MMIRGRENVSLAVRRQDGTIHLEHQRLGTLLTGKIRRVPLVRGVAVLAESLILGVKAMQRAANVALQGEEEGGEEIAGWVLALTLLVSLGLGVGIFFVLPLLIVHLLDPSISSDLVSNLIEGGLRLALLIGYIKAIGMLDDIKRVFAYHGAEHMAVHTYEAGLPLVVDNVRKFPTPHPRCGTAFLLTVVLVSILVFAFLQRPPIEWRIVSRIVLVPVIAGISYEVIRFSGAHQNSAFGHFMAVPGLLLQRLTTRQPDDSQIEVAICAMETAIAADEGREYAVPVALEVTSAENEGAGANLAEPEPPTDGRMDAPSGC